MELLVDADESGLREWLGRFRELLSREISQVSDAVQYDAWPGNIIVVNDELVVVDTEFACAEYPRKTYFGALRLCSPRTSCLTITVAERSECHHSG